MENFYLKETPKTPKIHLDAQTGEFRIAGRSIPENSIEFYKPVFDWLDECLNEPLESINVVIKLEYFNTSSSKCLVEVFRKLENIQKKGKKVEVSWFYEEDDEDMQESGEDFQELIKLPIAMKVIEDEEE